MGHLFLKTEHQYVPDVPAPSNNFLMVIFCPVVMVSSFCSALRLETGEG